MPRTWPSPLTSDLSSSSTAAACRPVNLLLGMLTNTTAFRMTTSSSSSHSSAFHRWRAELHSLSNIMVVGSAVLVSPPALVVDVLTVAMLSQEAITVPSLTAKRTENNSKLSHCFMSKSISVQK